MSLLKEKYKTEIKPALIKELGYENVMQVPALKKIVINRGLGEATSNSKAIETTVNTFVAITGQKPILTKAKQSVSNFKIREGQVIGCKVTLHGDKMYDFLTKLLNVSIPRIRDFRGVNVHSFDGRGNYTLGIKEDLIFPEIKQDALDRIRGFDISFITSANTDKEAYILLKHFGMPFRTEMK